MEKKEFCLENLELCNVDMARGRHSLTFTCDIYEILDQFDIRELVRYYTPSDILNNYSDEELLDEVKYRGLL